MGHHLGVFTGTCNRKSFCFASIMAELAALNLGIEPTSRISSKLQGTKEIIQVPENSHQKLQRLHFSYLLLWSKCTFSRLIIPFILCRYERKMCSTDECTVFKIQQKRSHFANQKNINFGGNQFSQQNFWHENSNETFWADF